MRHPLFLALLTALLAALAAQVASADPGDSTPAHAERNALEHAQSESDAPYYRGLMPAEAGERVADVAVPALDYDLARLATPESTASARDSARQGSTSGGGWDLTSAGRQLLFYVAVFVIGIALHMCLTRTPPRPDAANAARPGRAVKAADRDSARQPTPQR